MDDNYRKHVAEKFNSCLKTLKAKYGAPTAQSREATIQQTQKHQEALDFLRTRLGRTTASQIFNMEQIPEDKDGAKDNLAKYLAVIEFVAPEQSPALYASLARMVGQPIGPLGIKDAKDMAGNYKYYRFFPVGEMNDQDGFEVACGEIKIERDEYSVRFLHKSHNFSNEDEDKDGWEHRGLVFLVGSRLSLLGYRTRVLRSLIAHVPDLWGNQKGPLHGAILSVRNDDSIFSSRIVIAPENHDLYKSPPDEEKLKKLIRGKTEAKYGYIEGH